MQGLRSRKKINYILKVTTSLLIRNIYNKKKAVIIAGIIAGKQHRFVLAIFIYLLTLSNTVMFCCQARVPEEGSLERRSPTSRVRCVSLRPPVTTLVPSPVKAARYGLLSSLLLYTSYNGLLI